MQNSESRAQHLCLSKTSRWLWCKNTVNTSWTVSLPLHLLFSHIFFILPSDPFPWHPFPESDHVELSLPPSLFLHSYLKTLQWAWCSILLLQKKKIANFLDGKLSLSHLAPSDLSKVTSPHSPVCTQGLGHDEAAALPWKGRACSLRNLCFAQAVFSALNGLLHPVSKLLILLYSFQASLPLAPFFLVDFSLSAFKSCSVCSTSIIAQLWGIHLSCHAIW